jgi:hypothetical protein
MYNKEEVNKSSLEYFAGDELAADLLFIIESLG